MFTARSFTLSLVDGRRARYLAPASVDATTGALRLTPMQSDARLVIVKLGARFSL